MTKIVFVFDRVMHYHRALFERLDRDLRQMGHEMILLSGKEKASTTGRVALKTQVVRNQIEFDLNEWPIRSFMLRYQRGVAQKIREITPLQGSKTFDGRYPGRRSRWSLALG